MYARVLYRCTLSTLLCDIATLLLVMQSSDSNNGSSWQQVAAVCEFCGDALRWYPSVSDQTDHQTDRQTDHQTDRQTDQLYGCSNCHKYFNIFNSQLMNDDGGRVITDVDDVISSASATQDITSSPR